MLKSQHIITSAEIISSARAVTFKAGPVLKDSFNSGVNNNNIDNNYVSELFILCFCLIYSPVYIQNDPPQIATEFIPPPRVSDITPK